MNIGVVNIKGGVGKTTTSVHLAAYLQTQGPTVLFDGDPSHNALAWQERGSGFSFRIADLRAALKVAGTFKHSVTDTGLAPTDDDLKYLSEVCDLMVVPTTPRPLDTDGLKQTIQAFQRLGVKHYKVLLTSCPPPNEPEGAELTELLQGLAGPLFSTAIPRLKAFVKASGSGVLVSEVKDPRAERGWTAYVDVGKESLAYVANR